MYPRRNIQGIVILRAQVDVLGKVTGVRVPRSIPALDQAADAVRQWQYKVPVRDGIPVPFSVNVVANFMITATGYGNVEIAESIPLEQVGESVATPLGTLAPGDSREFSLSLEPPESRGRRGYENAALVFIRDEAGKPALVSTSRQRKTLPAASQ